MESIWCGGRGRFTRGIGNTSCVMASYRKKRASCVCSPTRTTPIWASTPEPETVPEITNHPWHITRKYGFGVNLEQNLTRNVTAFARWGWDDGRTESFAFTEIDSTFAEGVGVNGAKWHRKQDRAGIAFVSNGIKKDHQNYLANGGDGFLLGEGRGEYGGENIVESYYTAHVWRGIYVAPGVQYIVDPGYNRDRGPVVVPSLRAHVEF